MANHDWTPQQEAFIKAAKGTLSYAEIARQLTEKYSVPFTKDMVAGKFYAWKQEPAAGNKAAPEGHAAPPSDATGSTPQDDGSPPSGLGKAPGASFKSDGDIVTCVFHVEPDGVIREPEELLERAGVSWDKTKWEITGFDMGSWTTPTKISAEQVSTEPVKWQSEVAVVQNHTVKVKFRRLPPLDPRAVRDELMTDLKAITPTFEMPYYAMRIGPPSGTDKHMVEMCMFDPHIGKYSWREETGTNYDANIGQEVCWYALREGVRRVESFDIDHFLFPIGNDLVHVDNNANETTRGTRQDVDTRFKKVYRETRIMLVQQIGYLRSIAPVKVIVVPGNHDSLAAFTLGDTIEAVFGNDQHVTVDNVAFPRKYHSWNNVLLGFTHGDRRSEVNRLFGLMPQETRTSGWADARFCEFHLGHFHKRDQWQFNGATSDLGITVRVMNSLSGTDAWHAESGYVSGCRASNVIVWGPKHGAAAEYMIQPPDEMYGIDKQSA